MPVALTNPAALIGLLLVPYLLWVERRSLADQPRVRRRISLALRVAIVCLLVGALAGVQIVRRSDQLCVFFVLDRSDSITQKQRSEAVAYVQRALKEMHPEDLAGVIVAGSEALVELAPAHKLQLEAIRSTLSTTRTDLAAAIRLALAAFPDGTVKRIVVLSDGNENVGSALDEANLAAPEDVTIDVVPLAAAYTKEVLAEKLIVPTKLKVGEPFDLKLIVRSLQPTTAQIRLLRNDRYLNTYSAELVQGTNSLEIPQVIDRPGFYAYDCIVEPAADTIAENNRALGFCVIHGQPRVLYAEGDPGEQRWLLEALQAGKIQTDVVGLAGVPTGLGALHQYDSLILSDVRADLISHEQMKMIRAAVRDLGIGLIMIGGEDSFGIGGYHQTPVEDALPVYMDVRQKRRLPALAMELVLDKSGSMSMTMLGACKVDLAKEAAIAAVDLLKPQDEVGVIIFDHSFTEIVSLRKADHKDSIKGSIAQIRAGGGTQMYGAMERAYERLRKSDAKLKHCILLTDGQSMPADHEGLARKMAAAGITISAVAVGSDSARGLLQTLAKIGKGNYYYTDSPRSIPRIFTRETMLASRSFVIEKPFRPVCDPTHELLRGIDLASMPPLLGYVLTSKKELARLAMTASKGDPVLASWRYGLGRSVAFTSDAKARWASHWISWPGYQKFWQQIVRWTIRSTEKSPYQAWADVEGTAGKVVLEAIDRDGGFVNFLKAEARVIGPGLDSVRLPMEQTAPGRYEVRFPARDVGQYVINISYQDEQGATASQVTGVEVSYPPEYAELSPNEPLLARVSEVTGGKLKPEPQVAFVKPHEGARRAKDIWVSLAVLALLLFPLDVALRRLMIEREHLALFGEAFARLAWWRRIPVPVAEGAPLGRLLHRKRETAETIQQERPAAPLPRVEPSAGPAVARPAAPQRPPVAAAGGSASPDRMKRLLDAKRRAKPS
jgi:uncharacterized membrane protein/secreted protein with Ig-like and vWFA domain